MAASWASTLRVYKSEAAISSLIRSKHTLLAAEGLRLHLIRRVNFHLLGKLLSKCRLQSKDWVSCITLAHLITARAASRSQTERIMQWLSSFRSMMKCWNCQEKDKLRTWSLISPSMKYFATASSCTYRAIILQPHCPHSCICEGWHCDSDVHPSAKKLQHIQHMFYNIRHTSRHIFTTISQLMQSKEICETKDYTIWILRHPDFWNTCRQEEEQRQLAASVQ